MRQKASITGSVIIIFLEVLLGKMHYRSMKGEKINLYKKKVVLSPNKLVVTKVQWWLNLMANFVSDMHFL